MQISGHAYSRTISPILPSVAPHNAPNTIHQLHLPCIPRSHKSLDATIHDRKDNARRRHAVATHVPLFRHEIPQYNLIIHLRRDTSSPLRLAQSRGRNKCSGARSPSQFPSARDDVETCNSTNDMSDTRTVSSIASDSSPSFFAWVLASSGQQASTMPPSETLAVPPVTNLLKRQELWAPDIDSAHF